VSSGPAYPAGVARQPHLFEYYGVGEDESWGESLGKVTFAPTVLHDLRSVTKSLVGMPLWHRPGRRQGAGRQKPGSTISSRNIPTWQKQPGRDRITVAHVLSMTMGSNGMSSHSRYGDPRNSEIMMEAAPDRYRYILSLPIVGEPGVKWTYCAAPLRCSAD